MRTTLLLLLMFIFVFLAGCNPDGMSQINTFIKKYNLNEEIPFHRTGKYFIHTDETGEKSLFMIVVIDGCEYIESYGSHGEITFSHLGNCHNPIHRFVVSDKDTTTIIFKEPSTSLSEEIIETRKVADDLASILSDIMEDAPIEYLEGYVDNVSLQPYKQLVIKYRR